jgi:hypothetical protein
MLINIKLEGTYEFAIGFFQTIENKYGGESKGNSITLTNCPIHYNTLHTTYY